MAAEKGVVEAQQWLSTGAEPQPPAFVTPPPFSPPPSFQRAALQLSLMPLSEFLPEEKEEPVANQYHGQGSSVFTNPGDFAPEGKGRKGGVRSRPTRRGKLHRGRRRLSRDLRIKKAKKPSVYFGTDPPGPGWTFMGEGKWIQP